VLLAMLQEYVVVPALNSGIQLGQPASIQHFVVQNSSPATSWPAAALGYTNSVTTPEALRRSRSTGHRELHRVRVRARTLANEAGEAGRSPSAVADDGLMTRQLALMVVTMPSAKWLTTVPSFSVSTMLQNKM
jgi:hypothetical protein